MKEQPCGCCEGREALTPADLTNRPGLDALHYRVGVHAAFLETMKARLSNLELAADGESAGSFPLQALATREGDDPAIALLDAWATVADVLAFYQERIANEGYLRTAAERRSILELARLVGYRLRPGVAASAYLAFEIDKGYAVEIPAGTRAQSIPGPGELPQSFETVEPSPARAEWNAMKPRLTLPPNIPNSDAVDRLGAIYLAGIGFQLKPNDPLLFVFGDGAGQQAWRRVAGMEAQPDQDRTKVIWQRSPTPAPEPGLGGTSRAALAFEAPEFSQPAFIQPGLIVKIARPLAAQPWSRRYLTPDTQALWGSTSASVSGVWAAVDRRSKPEELYRAMAQVVPVVIGPLQSIHLLPVKAAPYGHNAPKEPQYSNGVFTGWEEWNLEKHDVTFTVRMSFEEFGGMIPTSPPNSPPIGFEIEIVVAHTDVCVARPLIWRCHLSDGFGETAKAEFDTTVHCAGLTVGISVTCQKSHQHDPWEWVMAIVTFHMDPHSPIVMQVTPGSDQVFAIVVTDPSVEGFSVSKSQPYEPNEDKYTGRILDKGVLEIGVHEQAFWAEYQTQVVTLDATYDQIKPDSWVIIAAADGSNRVRQVEKVRSVSVARYGIAGRVTQLVLHPLDEFTEWPHTPDTTLAALRSVTIYAQSEPVDWVDAPIAESVQGDHIELDGLYGGLREGQWIIVSGEPSDVRGVIKSELAMIVAVREDVHYVDDSGNLLDPNQVASATTKTALPRDTYHTTLVLAAPLAYTYKRDTVTIYGNVVKATHGETRKETLGSGDGRQGRQRFTLKQKPLTYVAAPSATGLASTLEVRVDDVLWHEAENLFAAGPNDRVYITQADDDENTSIVFGDGQAGARLPSGIENVRAVYRNGIGRPGNVIANQISLLATRPLGVKGVINPLDATGGADRDSRDQARRNAPLGVTALDRLVSVRDYADFALTYAGIGKASAARLSTGRRQVVHLTIAGLDDIPIDKTSDLYRGLTQALYRLGDRQQAVVVDLRGLIMLVVKARARLLPDYEWETVEPKIRSALLAAFGFERRELGQPVYGSEIIAVAQRVPGVAYVDLDLLVGISGADVEDPARLEAKLSELRQASARGGQAPPDKPIVAELAHVDSTGRIQPAQLAILTPRLPETLMLEVIE